MSTYVLQPPGHYRQTFQGSTRLFRVCWRQYIGYLGGSIDNPSDDSDVTDWLDSIASDKVNNSHSRFYIYG